MNAPTSIRSRIDGAPVATARAAVSATPYQWTDPASLELRQWIYGRQFLRGTVSLIVAPGATGKTALVIGTALALATGRPLLGKNVVDGPKVVWIWNLEDSTVELSRQVQAAAMHWCITETDLGGRLFVNSALDGDTLKLASETRDGLALDMTVVEAIVSELKQRHVDVLIVDPFVSSHDVNENSNGSIDAVAKLWALIAVRANCSVVLIHHVSKAGSGEVTVNSARGAVALTAAARSVVTLNRMDEAEAAKLGVDPADRRRYFRAYDDKNNRAPPADVSDWFELISVHLGNGPNGGDSMPVVVPWQAPDPFADVTVDHLRSVQAEVGAGEWRASVQSPKWVGVAIAKVLGLDLENPAEKARVKRLLHTWLKNGALATEQRPDGNREMRPFVTVGSPVLD